MRTTIALTLAGALALASCGGKEDGAGAGGGSGAAPVAAVAPPAGKRWTDVVERTAEGGYRMGNPDAPIKIIEFGSRTCPHCAKFSAEGFPALRDEYVATGKVSFEFRDFLIHAMDLAPTLLGQCGGADVYFPMLEQMMASQTQLLAPLEKLPADFQQQLQAKSIADQAGAWADALGYVEFVKQRGVPEQQARQCLADTKRIDAVSKGLERDSNAYQISGTPTFILNGSKVENVTEWPELRARLRAAGA